MAEPLDNHRTVYTPEGVALQLVPASALPRALAWLVDFVLRVLISLLLGFALGGLGDLGVGLLLVCLFLLQWGYMIGLEGRFGTTPGKRLFGLRVVAQDGAPLGWNAAIVRNLLRTVDMLPFGYFLGLVSCLFDRHSRRLGDLVARSQVVHVRTPGARTSTPDVPARLPLQPLQPDEQAVLVAFAERARLLSPARRRELATLAAPLTGATGSASEQKLYALANGLLGRQ
jgi:uncharacterized RDD family membrane protein YckC